VRQTCTKDREEETGRTMTTGWMHKRTGKRIREKLGKEIRVQKG
jgi:hypothetical protein